MIIYRLLSIYQRLLRDTFCFNEAVFAIYFIEFIRPLIFKPLQKAVGIYIRNA